MLHNYLVAALRHLARNRLYSAISVIGLAIGVCAALCAALVIHSELHYDQFFAGYERTYRVVTVQTIPERGPMQMDVTSSRLQRLFALRSSEIESSARVAMRGVRLRHGQIDSKESIYWADPSVFDVLPLPAIAGDLRNSLRRPDGIVLTRSAARKYFGRDDPVGQTLLIDLPTQVSSGMALMLGTPAEGTYPMTVTAVLEDLPGTQLATGIFASGLASYSALTTLDKAPANADDTDMFVMTVATFVRLSPGASLERLRAAVPDLVNRMAPRRPPYVQVSLEFVRVDALHALPEFNPGLRSRLTFTAVIGALILFVACVNFVNLLTARSATRAKEVAVRKATGASRSVLILQFVGESFIYVALAGLAGIALAEWTLPQLNTYLHFTARTDWWRHPTLFASVAAGAGVLGVLVGAYPAFVLSSFRPVNVLNGLRGQPRGTDIVRQGLVTLQFAILIGLLIVAGVVWQQRTYATTEALRVQTDQMLIIRSPCNTSLLAGLRALPGVRGVACTGPHLLGEEDWRSGLKSANGGGGEHPLRVVPTESHALDLLGLRPIAGDWPHEEPTAPLDARDSAARRYIINEAAVRELGFASPQAAIGQVLRGRTLVGEGGEENEVGAVVADFSLLSVDTPILPTLYMAAEPRNFGLVAVKLGRVAIPETLTAIDRVWRTTGARSSIDRFFLDDHFQRLYLGVLREAQAFGIFSMVAALLACLGLVGLSSSIAERRTREIGIRKAMGADTGDIVRLLLWQFSKPVVWANLIAWPVAGYAMNRWLHGFAYHTDLQPWLFAAAGLAALLFALLTVTAHSVLVARASPVVALRYE